MKNFQHIILGTGQATGTLLGKLLSTGDSIAVIEEAKVGGSCLNYGCTPTKTLVASARAIHMAQRGDYFGYETGPVRVHYSRVRERMNEIRDNSREGLAQWIEGSENVTLIREKGEFTGDHTLRVGDREISGERIYINTGARPVSPPVPGLDEVPWLDNSQLLDLEELPSHLLVLGGGYIGLEFAQIFRRFGSGVTIVQRGDQLMPREDRDVAEAIQSFLEEEGITVHLQAETRQVRGRNGSVQLDIEKAGSKKVDSEITLQGSHLLLATGRKPNSDGLALEKTGIAVNNRGYIEVDDYCRSSVEGVFALGDVNGKGAFTHTSVNDAEIVLDHLYGGKRKISDRIPIYALFTDPPLGRVGMTEKEALKQGKRVLRSTMPMNKISRAKEMGEATGFAKLLVDGETDLILGASILGPGGDEIINMFAAIMHSGISCREYRRVVLVHPTVSELMPFILDGLEEVE